MPTQLRSINDGTHVVGNLNTVNYALNPAMEVLDPTLLYNPRINLCANPSFEVDTTGWAAIGATAPTISQSFANSFVGAASLRITCNGSAASSNAAQFTISGLTIGITYSCSAYVYLPSGSFTGSVSCGINGLGTGTNTSTTNAWSRISITFTATGTSHGFLVYSSTYTTGQFFYADAVLIESGSAVNPYFDGSIDQAIARNNLCTNPSFETNTTSWSTGGSPAPTIATSTLKHLFGTKSCQITWPATGSLPFISYSFSTTVGKVYTVSAFVYVPAGNSNVLITIGGLSLAGQASTRFDDWERLSYTFVATGTSHLLEVVALATGTGTCYVDGVLIEAGSIGTYFDGSLPRFSSGITQAWSGAAHASTSTQSVPSGTVVWNGTAHESASTRNDQGPKWWSPSNSVITADPSVRVNGVYSAKMMPTLTSAIPKMSQTFNVIDSTNYSVSFHVYLPAATTGGGVSIEFDCYDSTSTLIALTVVPLLASGAQTVGFLRLATTFQAPAGTNTMTVSIRPPNQPSSLSDVIYIDNFMFEQADTSSPNYLDGSMTGYCWSGVAGESTTLQTTFAGALNFFGTFAYAVPPTHADGSVPMVGTSKVLPTSWPSVPLTD